MAKPDPTDFAALDGVVTALDGALERIDTQGGMTAAEQLAELAVACVRGLLPVLRAERDQQRAQLDADAADAE